MTELEGLSDASLLCRDLRHGWRFIGDINIVYSHTAPVEITRVLSCTNCGTERHDTLGLPSFDLVYRHYYYPDDYLRLSSGGQRVSVSDIRRTYYERTYGKRLTAPEPKGRKGATSDSVGRPA